MKSQGRGIRVLPLALGVASVLLGGCHRGLLSDFPTFDLNRPERIGEPFTVVPSESKSLYVMQLSDKRRVQAMPLYVLKRDESSIRWQDLAMHVTVPSPAERGRENPGFIPPDVFIVSPDPSNTLRPSKNVRVQATLSVLKEADPLPKLREQEAQFLQLLDKPQAGTPYLSTTVVLVCVPHTNANLRIDRVNQCFQPGERYDITVRLDGHPATIVPFQVERHNDVFGAGLGFLLTLLFVGYNIS